MKGPGEQWLHALRRDLGFVLQFFTGRNFFFGGNPHDIALFTHRQAFGLQDDVQRLVPRHVFQPKGYRAGHGVGRDDIELGEICNDLEYGAHVNTLKIQRDFLTGIAAGVSRFGAFNRLYIDQLDLHCQFVADLKDVEIPFPIGLNGDPYPIPGLGARDGLHRRGEISNIHAPAQSRRQSHLVHFNRQTRTLPPNIRYGLIRRQLQQDQPRTLRSPLEIDVLQDRPHRHFRGKGRLRPHSRNSS